jgi:hypothetical protein
VHEDLADLDALAALTQRSLHCLSRADDADAAQALGKLHTHIRVAYRMPVRVSEMKQTILVFSCNLKCTAQGIEPLIRRPELCT